jgi:cellobiose phosphorylase
MKPTEPGHFSADALEYVVTTPCPPHRDWFNFLWNERYLACAGASLGGFSLYQNEAGVVTNLFGKQDQRDAPRALYLRDEATGRVWSAGFLPCATRHAAYACCHGLGYSVLTTRAHGIEVRMRVFVPRTLAGEIWSVTVRNLGPRPRRLSVFAAARIRLDGAHLPYGHLSGLSAAWQPRDRFLFFQNLTHTVAHEKYRAFFSCSRPPRRWDASEDAFLGRARNFARPAGVTRGRLANSPAAAEDMVGALQHTVRLPGGGSWTAHYTLGVAKDLAEARAAVRRHGSARLAERAFERTRAFHRARVGRLRLDTPDARLNRLCNSWLQHQLYLMADWARFYFKGFRDTCQDAAGLSMLDPARARLLLHRALRNQRSDGYAPRAFRVPSREVASADKPYADSASWISHATGALLAETGDRRLLDEVVPYADGGRGTVWEHNLRALDFLWRDRGAHGLSRIHYGDWNDLMDRVGTRNRGESVWMSCALARALRLMAGLADWRGDAATAARCRRRFAILRRAILRHGWDGRHFLYAINDDGMRIGSRRSREGRFFLNPQTWALLAGVIKAERYTRIMRRLEPVLDTPVGPVHHWPPYTRYHDGIGQLSGTPPGFFTNGNVYCHAAAFKIAADLEAGRADHAYETLCRILPSAGKSEPFAQANGYAGPSARRLTRGVSDDPWRTGTVAWHFLNVVDRLLGFERTYEGVRFAPRLPSSWRGARFTRPFRGRIFEVEIARGRAPGVWVDGHPCRDGFLPVAPGRARGRVVRVRCVIAAAPKRA